MKQTLANNPPQGGIKPLPCVVWQNTLSMSKPHPENVDYRCVAVDTGEGSFAYEIERCDFDTMRQVVWTRVSAQTWETIERIILKNYLAETIKELGYGIGGGA